MDVQNYALAIGYNDQNQAACIILSTDGMEVGGQEALQATLARVADGDLHLTGAGESVVLKQIPSQHISLIESGLPVVVLDPENETEALIPSQ